MRQVGARLRRTLDALGLSYVEAAELMGKSKQTLNGWMAGEGYPDCYSVYRLSRAAKVTFDWLFLGDWSELPSSLKEKVAPEWAVLPRVAEEPGLPGVGRRDAARKKAPSSS